MESEPPQATKYELYQATQKLTHAWGQMVNSIEAITQRIERLDSVISKTNDKLSSCQIALQKRLIGVDDEKAPGEDAPGVNL